MKMRVLLTSAIALTILVAAGCDSAKSPDTVSKDVAKAEQKAAAEVAKREQGRCPGCLQPRGREGRWRQEGGPCQLPVLGRRRAKGLQGSSRSRLCRCESRREGCGDLSQAIARRLRLVFFRNRCAGRFRPPPDPPAAPGGG